MAGAKIYGGRWETLESIGEGGQGHVFVVHDKTRVVDELCVLKRLKNVNNRERRQRFKLEVEALRRLSHPNVLRISDWNVDCAQPYYVAEYCEGRSVESAGADRFKANVAGAMAILLPISDALVAAHQAGVIHRDVKPGNILLRGDGSPALGDFGICHLDDGVHVTLSGDHVGSINYIAPEMRSGRRHLGEPSDRTDVYSLGKVLYWMLSGGHIFDQEDHRPNSLVDELGDQKFEHVHMLFDRMIVESPSKRMGSQEVRREFEMTSSLVEGNFAPLEPSIGIRCRFCGLGKYERYAEYSRNNPPGPSDRTAANAQNIGKQRLEGLGFKYDFADVRVLRCTHCGHIQAFHSMGITDRDWWNR
jgi:serine/threonine protein kinase